MEDLFEMLNDANKATSRITFVPPRRLKELMGNVPPDVTESGAIVVWEGNGEIDDLEKELIKELK
jgi:hypothetical protein